MTDNEIKDFVTYGKGPRVTVVKNLENGTANGETILYKEGNG
jgi:hypothetical protein